ncbi:MAG: hypothetical protein K2I23_05385, partial [Clostridia bacterium]|nr:hypothetical protein [Clostridia bacterium]
KYSVLTENQLKDELPTNARKYVILYSLKAEESVNYEIDAVCIQAGFEIEKIKIKAVWNTDEEIPILSNLDDEVKDIIGYIYFDEEGNQLDEDATLEAGKSYKVKAILKGDYADNYEFVAEDGETVLDNPAMTDEQDFNVKDNNSQGGNVGIGSGEQPEEPTPQPPAQSFDILGFLKDNWQPLVCVLSVILIVIFMGKGMSYASKSKKLKKTKDKKYSSYYAAVAGLFGLPQTTWTIVACIMAGIAVLAFIFMLLEKRMLSKAEEEFEDAKDEYEQAQAKKKDDEMRMMLMGMLGGNGGQQGYAYVSQPQIGLEDMRGMINDAVTAMLPNVQQYLPQQASGNDDLVEKLLEKTSKNEETIQKLIKKMAEQPTEKVVETVVAREVASASVVN